MNNLILCTLVGQAVFLYVSFLAPKLLAEEDHIQIDLNGSLDTFKDQWHRVNSEVRFLMFFPLAMLAVMPAAILGEGWNSIGLAFFLAAASGALNLSFHWIVFDKELNRLRDLDYDYIGKNAKLDLYLAKHPKAKTTAIIVSSVVYFVALFLLISYLY